MVFIIDAILLLRLYLITVYYTISAGNSQQIPFYKIVNFLLTSRSGRKKIERACIWAADG